MPTANFAPGQAVLVVEDDPVLRMLAAEVLDDAGYEALEAADAQQAMDILESRFDIILMFTDIDMPGSLNGLELAARVRDRWPPIEIAITSGHALLKNSQLPAGAIFIPKPYGLLSLVKQFQEMIH